MEEQYVFPVLSNKHEGVKNALKDHKRVKALLESEQSDAKSLLKIADELASHIRFEERVLFNEIQKSASDAELTAIERLHADNHFCENQEDEFWK